MTWLRLANLVLSVLAMLAPMAHVLELPNKLSLDGCLWLAVQQHLYRGWGPLLGGPAEVGALTTSLLLAVRQRRNREVLRPTLVAVFGYAAMLVGFFVFNRPVNQAVTGWTPASLPADWTTYRLHWEIGHALAALLSAISLAAVILAGVRETRA